MRKLSPLVILLLSTVGLAQTPQKVFFMKNGARCNEADAYVYQLATKPQNLYMPGLPTSDEDTLAVVYFARTNGVCMKYSCVGGFHDGPYELYYENGQLKEKGVQHQRRTQGKVTRYYPNGSVQEVIDFPEEGISPYKSYDFLILEYRDSAGVQIVKDGNGMCRRYTFSLIDSSRMEREEGLLRNGLRDQEWSGYYHDTLYYKERFSNGKFIDGVRYADSKEIRYEEVERQPEYRGGMEALARFISRTLEYPKDARRNGVDGKAFVQFVVSKDGSVIDVHVIKGVSPSINEEAERVVRLMPAWEPAFQRGVPIKARFILPIRFKLDTDRRGR